MKQEVKNNELDLIREWKHNKNQDIALYFFNKYKDEVLNIIYQKINRKFSSVPIEKGDLFYSVWKSVLKVLDAYKLSKKGCFKDILINCAYFNSLKEALKFIKNSHIILNNAYSYEKLLDENKNFNFGKNSQISINYDFNIARQRFIEEVISLNEKFDPKFLKRVVYLKSLGYSIKEISEKINCKVYDVKLAIDFMVRIAKRLYN